ncbi:MAG: hypothetical protein FJX77_15075, partial [Armatimonadetes bacterium]|nr:hypothetical protein [Armatimonadota bacterium]
MGTGFGFLAREAWLNCRRQPLLLLACFSTTAIALTTLGAFALLAWNVHRMAEDIPRRFEVHAFLRVGAPPGQAQRLVGKLQALPGVRQVRLVPRAAAWA